MSSQARYHKSAENADDGERATVKPLGVSYARFTVLERVLMVALTVFIVLTILFVILYATNKTSGIYRIKPVYKHSKLKFLLKLSSFFFRFFSE